MNILNSNTNTKKDQDLNDRKQRTVDKPGLKKIRDILSNKLVKVEPKTKVRKSDIPMGLTFSHTLFPVQSKVRRSSNFLSPFDAKGLGLGPLESLGGKGLERGEREGGFTVGLKRSSLMASASTLLPSSKNPPGWGDRNGGLGYRTSGVKGQGQKPQINEVSGAFAYPKGITAPAALPVGHNRGSVRKGLRNGVLSPSLPPKGVRGLSEGDKELAKPINFKFKTSYSKMTEMKLITVSLASANRIRQWAEKMLPNGKVVGEVINAETLHYKTFKPIKGGLFCERIFGPTKDHTCACGKKFNLKNYLNQEIVLSGKLERIDTLGSNTPSLDNPVTDSKNSSVILNKNIQKRYFCRVCDVEYTFSTIRRTQLGYIQLATPVTHVWYVKGVPNYMSILLDMRKKDLHQIIYNYGTLTFENALKGKQLVTVKPSDLYDTWIKVAKGNLPPSPKSPKPLLGALQTSFVHPRAEGVKGAGAFAPGKEGAGEPAGAGISPVRAGAKAPAGIITSYPQKNPSNKQIKNIDPKEFFLYYKNNKRLYYINRRNLTETSTALPTNIPTPSALCFYPVRGGKNSKPLFGDGKKKQVKRSWYVVLKHLLTTNSIKAALLERKAGYRHASPVGYPFFNIFSLWELSSKTFNWPHFFLPKLTIATKFKNSTFFLNKQKMLEKRPCSLTSSPLICYKPLDKDDINGFYYIKTKQYLNLKNVKMTKSQHEPGLVSALTNIIIPLYILYNTKNQVYTKQIQSNMGGTVGKEAVGAVIRTMFGLAKAPETKFVWGFGPWPLTQGDLVKGEDGIRSIKNIEQLTNQESMSSLLNQSIDKSWKLLYKFGLTQKKKVRGQGPKPQTNEVSGAFAPGLSPIVRSLDKTKFKTKLLQHLALPNLVNDKIGFYIMMVQKSKKNTAFFASALSGARGESPRQTSFPGLSPQPQTSQDNIADKLATLMLLNLNKKCLNRFLTKRFALPPKPPTGVKGVTNLRFVGGEAPAQRAGGVRTIFTIQKTINLKGNNLQKFVVALSLTLFNIKVKDKLKLYQYTTRLIKKVQIAESINKDLKNLIFISVKHSAHKRVFPFLKYAFLQLLLVKSKTNIKNYLKYKHQSMPSFLASVYLEKIPEGNTVLNFAKQYSKKLTVNPLPIKRREIVSYETSKETSMGPILPIQCGCIIPDPNFIKMLVNSLLNKFVKTPLPSNLFSTLNRCRTAYSQLLMLLPGGDNNSKQVKQVRMRLLTYRRLVTCFLQVASLSTHNLHTYKQQFIQGDNEQSGGCGLLNEGPIAELRSYPLCVRGQGQKPQTNEVSGAFAYPQGITAPGGNAGLGTSKKTVNLKIAQIFKNNIFSWLSNNIYCLSHRYVWEEDQEKNWRRFTLFFYPPKSSIATSIPVYKNRNYNELFNFDQMENVLSDLRFTQLSSPSPFYTKISLVPKSLFTLYPFGVNNKGDSFSVSSRGFAPARFIPLFTPQGAYKPNPPRGDKVSQGDKAGTADKYSSIYLTQDQIKTQSPETLNQDDTLARTHREINRHLSYITSTTKGMNIHTTFSGPGIIQKLLNEFNFTELKKMDKQNRILLFEYNKHVKNLKKVMDPRSLKSRLEYYKACHIRDVSIRRTKLIRKIFSKATPAGVPLINSGSQTQSTTYETEGLNMILTVLPVLPPDLRPIVKTDGKQATADLNTFYKNIIYRNERLKKFLKDPALNSSFEMKYAQRLVQESVDNLIQNGKGGVAPIKDARGRLLKSLSDGLKGKQGRFRQYLLGKRVDYSARSVIVVGPRLKLHECGIPKEIALALYFPFLIKRILNQKLALTVPGAKGLIHKKPPLVWQLLREIMKTCPVILNRAPTLHRLGFQAFQPKLVEGKAILLHPLVCPAFNADFDGDQMAVHVPITYEAKAEAWKLMLSRNNLLSPATGEPILLPSQDMVLGCYYLTTNCAEKITKYKRGTGFYFHNINEVLKAYNQQLIDLHAVIWVNMSELNFNSPIQDQPLEIRIPTIKYKMATSILPTGAVIRTMFGLAKAPETKFVCYPKGISESPWPLTNRRFVTAPTFLPALAGSTLTDRTVREQDASKVSQKGFSEGQGGLGADLEGLTGQTNYLIKTNRSLILYIYSKLHQFVNFNGILSSQIVRTTPGRVLFNTMVQTALNKRPKLLNNK